MPATPDALLREADLDKGLEPQLVAVMATACRIKGVDAKIVAQVGDMRRKLFRALASYVDEFARVICW